MATPKWELDPRKSSIFVTVKEPYDYIFFCYTLYDENGKELECTDYIGEVEYRFTGLTTGAKYTVRLDWMDAYGDEGHDTLETQTVGVRSWSWSNRSGGDATLDEIKDAKEAIDNHGRTSSFSHLVWNDLVNKVNECKHASGVLWNNKYTTYGNTLMEDDTVLTALRFNSLRYNIDIHEETGINEVFAGDIVYGHYFTDLTDAMNSWIDDINNS